MNSSTTLICKRLLCTLLCICMICAAFPVAAYAAEEATENTSSSLENFEYSLDEGNQTVTLTKYIGSATSIDVPGSYTLEEKNYSVVIDSSSCFARNTSITSVTLHDGVQFKDNSMFCLFGGCTKLSNVDLTELNTSEVTDMSFVFFSCSKLTVLDLSGFDTSSVVTMKGMFSKCTKLETITGYEHFDTSSLKSIYQTFNYVQSMEKIDLSNWDLDQLENSGWCFQQCYAKEILLPDNIAVISAGFFNHATKYADSSFAIPAGVKKIGYAHTFYDFGTSDFTEFKVAEGNENYVAIDGVLYNADGTEIIAVPRGLSFDNGAYEIKEGVTFIPELSFSRNSNVTSVTIPNSYQIRQFVPANDPQYVVFEDDGNLNGGNSLTIAFYIYTGITDYSVKEDNPQYASESGIIYSKDMSTLVAVPAKYDQYMDIPEGVTTWNTYAMWAVNTSSVDQCMVNCPGVYIPATLTNIAQDQIDMMNRLNGYRLNGKTVSDGTAYTFTITVDENNPVYRTDENGNLVQYGIADQDVVVEQQAYTYDGTEKTPAVTVSMDGTELVVDTDYSVEYANNINAGTATVTVKGIGNYGGTVSKTFVISPKDISGVEVSVKNELIYTGEEQQVIFTVGDVDGLSITYDVSGDSAIHVGVYQFTITGTGNFCGEITELYTVFPDTSLIDELTVENVNSADKANILAVKEMVENAVTELADEATIDEWNAILENCDALITRIEEAASAVTTESIVAVEDITAENVSLGDKTALENAMADYESAVSNYEGNYTGAEKSDIAAKIDLIEAALEAIDNAQNVIDAIAALPETVSPDNEEAVTQIEAANDAYTALNSHEKSLVDEVNGSKLNTLLEELTAYEITDGSGSSWQKGNSDGLSFTANGLNSKLVGIKIDGTVISADCYSIAEDSTTITLTSTYLETLDNGTHTITVEYIDGEASCEFVILEADGNDDNLGAEIIKVIVGIISWLFGSH